jgi:hypothetical protein
MNRSPLHSLVIVMGSGISGGAVIAVSIITIIRMFS